MNNKESKLFDEITAKLGKSKVKKNFTYDDEHGFKITSSLDDSVREVEQARKNLRGLN